MAIGKEVDLNKIISENIEMNHGVVVYRLPHESHFKLEAGNWNKVDQVLPSHKGQFILSPFNKEKHSTILIEPSVAMELPDLNSDSISINGTPEFLDEKNNSSDFKTIVGNGIERIKKGEFLKVVLSRKKELELNSDFNPITFLERLSIAYPECFCYFFLIPGEACWLGATPELLASFDRKGKFKTVSLAGTLPENYSELGLSWTEKEIGEQKIVSDYILNILDKHGIQDVIENGPSTINTGKLVHLRSTFENKAGLSHEKYFDLIRDLHPTPAICGLPKTESMRFIEDQEKYDREYYSGFIGSISQNEETSLFVNLRCMQLFKNRAILYAGAGITADSDPQKELDETERKLNALRIHLDA